MVVVCVNVNFMKKILIVNLFLIACNPDFCFESQDSDTEEKCCKSDDIAIPEETCPTHPFGRAPYCNGIEEPQTTEKCFLMFRLNNLCFDEYETCRNDLRNSSCDECPESCLNIQGACKI